MALKRSTFIESECEESEEDELESTERSRSKKMKASMADSSDEEEEDDVAAQEVLDDLIDDREIEEDSDGSASSKKHKKSDEDDDLDDRLEDDDYDLIEENLGVKVQRRKRFRRVRQQIDDDESEGEGQDDNGDLQRERIAERIFDTDDEAPRSHSEQDRRTQNQDERGPERDVYDDEDDEDESDDDGFIVDDDGVPITSKRKPKRTIFTDASLQEGQDIFGVDFDYDEFEKYDEDEYEDEYEVDGDTEKRPKKQAKKKSTKKSIFEIYEPSELKRGHFTDTDIEIRKKDMPERMQLREVPISKVPEGSSELDEEAEWIYKQAFCKETVSTQNQVIGDGQQSQNHYGRRKLPSTINKIRQALDFMRNQQLEVPFIAFYRKEYVEPELNITDLWKVYQYDGKWCQLLTRKRALLTLFEKMHLYQQDKMREVPESQVMDDCRLIREDDMDRLRQIQTPEELKDVHMHFLLYYSNEIPAMHEAWRTKERLRRQREKNEAREKLLAQSGERNEELEEANTVVSDEEGFPMEEQLKHAADTGPYSICRRAGICGMAKRFGLTPDQFAENLRDNYQRHEVEQEPIEPMELAKQYLSPRFTKVEDVLEAAKFVVARQISREPLLKRSVREVYFERARLSVKPTKKGSKEIDENHPCYGMKYLKNKPVRDLVGDQFLRLQLAEEDKLLEIIFHDHLDGFLGSGSSGTYLDDIKALYQRDEFAKNVQEWNHLRAQCVEMALVRIVLPEMRKELRALLLAEAKDAVMRACCRKLANWLRVAPYKVSFPEEDEYDWEVSKGIRVMGVAYVPDPNQAAFCALVNGEGEVTDYLRVPNILRRRGRDEKVSKDGDLMAIKEFIRSKKPHVIALGGESREALQIQMNLNEVIKSLREEEQFPAIAVEVVDNELAKIYSNSNKGVADFREYPTLLRQAVSLARKLQDPLIEFSQLCTADEEILCLRYNMLQDHLPREDLLEKLYLEFINRTNEVGVDINLAVQNPTYANLVQFVCGLGPRKGQALIKILKQTNQRLENRTQLVTSCHMGPKVFINCSGFVKIDTSSLGDSTEAYVEVLDGSRVHPETYEWARKMAIDALEYDDEQMNPAGALDEILVSPDRLKDLDLDAFAVELERQGFGNKSITLYDIRAELNCRYKDLRKSYQSPNAEELFDMLTKETPETFYVGKMVLATVTGFTYKKPQGEQLDQANPVRNDETGLWQCPFCMKNDFPELSEVWNHFDAKSCTGQATGVRVALDNGLSGFIHIKNLSDKHVRNPEERVQKQQTIHVRIIKIDVDRFSVDCSSKSTDLMDRNHEWRPAKDPYYDQEAEDADHRIESDTKKQKIRQQYVKRVIVHPAFHNKSYSEALSIMANMDQGEAIIRPSSKGPDHLTVTWKVTNNIYQHIDVREEGKENDFCLGQSLWIGNEEFEDLDEIIARHINPMASYARDMLSYRYYRDTNGGQKDKAEEFLKEEKRNNVNKIHYILSASKNYPGKFLLSYLPRLKCKHEYVSILPEGFQFRHQLFDNINALLKWFKEHFRDPVPGVTPVVTPRQQMSSRPSPYSTPNQMSATNPDAIAKVAQNIPNQLLHSLSQVAHQTPHYPQTPYGQSTYINTPYTPSGQTPFMTPYTSQTPRYGQSTPTMSGPFVVPGAPIHGSNAAMYHNRVIAGVGSGVGPNPGYHASPIQQQQQQQHGQQMSRHPGDSPYNPSPHSGRYGGGGSGGREHEGTDWARANDAWARGSRNQSSVYSDSMVSSRGGVRRGSSRASVTEDSDNFLTPYDERPPSRSRSDYAKSPRSIRSTPRINSSPHSTILGDATPLYDEN